MKGRAALAALAALVLLPLLLASCTADPCERPSEAGHAHYTMPGKPISFDVPTDWDFQTDLVFVKADDSGAGRSVVVEFHARPLENYPHIYSGGQILTDQEWGTPFPGRAVEITARELEQDGYPGLTVGFDFAEPLTLMDGTSPVTDWGYMQFTFLVAEATMFEFRFYASDQGQEKQIRREFDKLVESICILPHGGADHE